MGGSGFGAGDFAIVLTPSRLGFVPSPPHVKIVHMETLTASTTYALNQMLEPLSSALSVEAAEAIRAMEIPPDVQARLQELADRSNEGLLDEREQAEYRGYVEGAEILSLLKLKVRRLLKANGRG